jgi:ArsR family transcriptional regulator
MALFAPLPIVSEEQRQGRTAELLAALAHGKRLAILRVLLERELCVCELQSTFGWSQPLISHHLGILRKAGIVQDRRDAQWVYYSVAAERLAELHRGLDFLLDGRELPAAARCGANQLCCSPE